ncbi:MAG: protease modulator HflK [Planctomycetaceae bacterium]
MTGPRRSAGGLWAAAAAGANMFRWVAVLLIVLFCGSGITSIDPQEVGLLLRGGRLTGTSAADGVLQPGLVFALPYPIDEIRRVPIRQEGQIVIEDLWRPLTDPGADDRIDPLSEGYCLTGDQHLLQAKLVVKFRISDPVVARLRIADAERILRDMAIASLTQTVAAWGIDDAWRRHRTSAAGDVVSLERDVESALNERLNRMDLGVSISAIEFQEIHPPRHVRAEFADVQNALAESQQSREQAEGEAAALRLAGEAEHQRLRQQAVADREQSLAQAAAEVTVVKDLLEEYRRNPGFVRQRLRLDALTDLHARNVRQKVIPPGQSWRLIISDQEGAR